MTNFWENVLTLKKYTNELYIYGTGLYGQNMYRILKERKITVDGFLVTEDIENQQSFDIPVKKACDFFERNDIGIILGLNRNNETQVREYLRKNKFDEKNVISCSEYIEGYAERGGYDQIPTIEITTKIGCSVNCRFCPQNVLITNYFEVNTDRDVYMSIDTFIKCLEKMPNNCHILFCGMAEPFLNPNCLQMMKIACDSGRKVDLYTTLMGANLKIIEEVCKLPLNFVTLHVADEKGYANILKTDEYYEMVKVLLNCKKEDGSAFVNMCNAQTNPDKCIADMCRGKYDILTTMLDRAGNLNDVELYSKRNLKGKVSCSICGQALNHNILLPDGTLLLCCMDYGMKHVLGNLMQQTYDEIMNGKVLNEIRRGMCGDESIDLLCRNCSSANCYT